MSAHPIQIELFDEIEYPVWPADDEPETLPLRAIELMNMLDATDDPEERERLRIEIAFCL